MTWFTPKCPLEEEDRIWIEDWALWLCEAFELEPLSDVTVVLPTPEYFPDPYTGRPQDVRKLFQRVCEFMEVDPARVQFELSPDAPGEIHHRLPYYDGWGQTEAGQYQDGDRKLVVKISEAYRDAPMSFVSVVAHELGLALLLGDGKVTGERDEWEELADLLTAMLGLGVFGANAAITVSQWNSGLMQGWEVQRNGFLSSESWGYALAFFAWLRNEQKPEWSQYLEGDVIHYFKASAKYLAKVGEATLDREATKARQRR